MAPEEFFVRNSEGLFWAGYGRWIQASDPNIRPYRYGSYEAACADVSRVFKDFEIVIESDEGWLRYTPPVYVKMDGSARPNKIVKIFRHALEGETVLIRWNLRDGGFFYQEVLCPPKATREAQTLHQIDALFTERDAPGGTL